MADRYWVGGTAAWDGTAGTKWSTTSGGAGGASVPTSADDVFFDANSTGTCTISSGNTGAKSINCTGFTGTLAGSAAITVSGSVTLVAGMTYSHSGVVTIAGTGTLTTAGQVFSALTVDGVGITVTLGDALNMSSRFLTVTRGTFVTSNYNVTTGRFASTNSNIRTINLGSSTVTSSGALAVELTTNTNLTFDAGTSTIVCSSSSVQLIGGTASVSGVTFFNVSFTNTNGTTNSISGVNTFNNLTITAPSSAGVTQVTFDSRQTINGTLSTTGTAGNRRVWFRSSTYGLARTLTINATPSFTDADFRDIYVVGTASPISGTRVGDLRGCSGITFDTPKNCYRIGTGNWSDNQWSDTSGGSVSTDYFPLAQDTAVFDQNTTAGTHTMDTAITYTGTIDMSARTSALTLSLSAGVPIVYGSWTNGSGVSVIGASSNITFSGRNTQTVTSAGKTFPGTMTIDSYGGSVELADALNIGSNTLTVTNGTFDTKSYNVTALVLTNGFAANVRTINLGSSTITLSSNGNVITFGQNINFTFNAGTSQINLTGANSAGINCVSPGVTFNNVTFTGTTANWTPFISGGGINTFNNLTVSAPSSAGIIGFSVASNQTITGTLTVAGASPVRRIFVRSDTLGTQRTLNVGTLSADDCDFRDIAITGTAAGSSPTRAGDCGGNSGITFPAAKTVYWNLAGAQNWSATAWAPSSGGTPDINNFPLAQDTAVFDDTGSVTGTITINAAWNIGTFDASLRTSAMTLTTGSNTPFVYGDWKFGTGVTSSSTGGTITFAQRGTQTITSNGVQFGCPVSVNCVTGVTQLADAFIIGATRFFSLVSGTFDAVAYSVTVGLFDSQGSINRTLKMGSATWTISGTGTVWGLPTVTNLNFYKGTANIVLSDTSTTARTFAGGGLSYNKLTIGGTTGTSTLTITGNNQFTELASTKTVAHTIALGSTTQTFGKWTVTGTSGNVVTLTGTGASHILAGACTDGIDYLAMGSIGFAATSPGEFYAGVNSTGTAAAPVYRTAKPADSTRYWVGGTGNWSDTARWSTSSGGASGADVPRSHDDVVFDSSSNATAYTATVNAVTGGIRMKSLTIAGPASGNVTLAGSTAMVGIHGNVTLPATGLTRTYTGTITLTGSTSGKTLTTNGVSFSGINVNGVGCEWTLSDALNATGFLFTLTNGSFDTAGYTLTTLGFQANNTNSKTLSLGATTWTNAQLSSAFNVNPLNFSFNSGTSSLVFTGGSPTISTITGLTFYNVSFTSTAITTAIINGANTFNDLSVAGRTSAGIANISLSADQTINGTLTLSAGTNATMRHFVRSDTLGTTRTLTCAAVASLQDVDFRDITIAGSAAPASGTRIGDCKGNSGITFTAAANKYWNLAGGGNWSATGWATSSGGTPNVNDFPLAQDTCFFEATGLNSGATVTINQSYNIGTIDMSARTTNTMTLAVSQQPTIYGNWINGTGTTVSGVVVNTFAGRTTQTFTSAGKNTPFALYVDSPGGMVVLQDAYSSSTSGNDVLTITRGTFDAATYNVTLSGAAAGVNSSNSNTRTIAVGSGTWTIAGTSPWATSTSTNLTVTGTGTISLTSASAKTFAGGGVSYSGITLDQGGAGTLTITGNNTFANITNTYSATGATTIAFGTTTQRVGSFTATGAAGNVLTLTGTSASSPATLVLTSGTVTTPDYLTITGIRAYDLNTTWYAGANSTNNGSLGWLFQAAGGTTFDVSFSDTATGDDAFSAALTLSTSFSDTTTGSDTISASFAFDVSFSDAATGDDAISAACIFLSATSESATGADTATVAGSTFNTLLNETATGQDTTSATGTFNASLADIATGADAFSAIATLDAAFSDTATGADAISAGLVFVVSLSDTATGADAFSAATVFVVSFSDTATGTDASSVVASVFGAQTAETAGLQDTLTTTASLGVAFSDVASLVDSPAALVDFTSSFADTAVGSDEIAGGYVVLTVISESATGADAFAVAASVFTPSFTDTVTGTDAVVVLASSFSAEVSDIVVGTDAPDAAGSVFGSSLSDTATLFDLPSVAASTFGAALSDTVTGADAPAAVVTFPVSFSDTATGVDALAAQMSFATSLSETATLSDATAVAASVFNPAVQDLALALDTPAVVASTFGAVLNETVQAQDVPAALMIFPVSFSDTATAADALAAQMVFATAIAELATGTDATSALVIFVSSVSETASGFDVAAVAASTFNASFSALAVGQDTPAVAGSTFNVSLSETGAITDVVVGGYLWNPIDDTQNANWQNVVTAQSPGWVQINDAQGPNWVEIQT